MVACPGHIMESTNEIVIKLGTYIDVNERKCKRQRTIILSYILHLSLIFFIKVVFFVMAWCTSGVELQVLPFIDNRHLWSILPFQRFSCFFELNVPQSIKSNPFVQI